jgi:toxin-antitoxin system PIN domain toxin
VILLDANVLVRAHRTDYPGGPETLAWLEHALVSDEGVAVWDSVLVSTYRILTLPIHVREKSAIERALEYLQQIRDASHVVGTGDQYWQIFRSLIKSIQATGNLVTDAAIAAVTVENNCRLATFDKDFARFPGLQWFHPPI